MGPGEGHWLLVPALAGHQRRVGLLLMLKAFVVYTKCGFCDCDGRPACRRRLHIRLSEPQVFLDDLVGTMKPRLCGKGLVQSRPFDQLFVCPSISWNNLAQ